MNVTAHYDFLDPTASEASRFNRKLGVYRNVYEELIDQEKFKSTNVDHDCFTLYNYKTPYYVNEKVKNALENRITTARRKYQRFGLL
ncbi:hypothetical protein CTT30_09775 [Vibrio coralliilyticus]|nr:hypothetical protein CTT30_09775 [Vibrio coralliilyticus]